MDALLRQHLLRQFVSAHVRQRMETALGTMDLMLAAPDVSMDAVRYVAPLTISQYISEAEAMFDHVVAEAEEDVAADQEEEELQRQKAARKEADDDGRGSAELAEMVRRLLCSCKDRRGLGHDGQDADDAQRDGGSNP